MIERSSVHRSKAGGSAATVRLAAEFRNWHLADCHWNSSRGRRLQLPHRERPRRDRGRRWLIRGLIIRLLVIQLAGGRRPPRAILFKIGKHKIVLRQQTVTLAKFYRRRILGRKLAPGRSITEALRRGQMVRHGMLANSVGPRDLARPVGYGSSGLWISVSV
jgi:hypothetical protein